MKNTLIPAAGIAALFALTSGVQAAVISTSQTFNASPTTVSSPSLSDIYFYGSTATWTINGNITIGDGIVSGHDSRLFVGLNGGAGQPIGNGNLTLFGGTPDASLLLNGGHTADGVLGRLGHTSGGVFTGTINVTGGLDVTMGGRALRFDGGANTINVMDGSISYTTAGFAWDDQGAGTVGHTLSAGGSITIPGVVTDLAGFNTWAVNAGAGTGEVTVSAASGLSLNFANNGSTTTITAVPEPASAALAALGSLALLRRRRK